MCRWRHGAGDHHRTGLSLEHSPSGEPIEAFRVGRCSARREVTDLPGAFGRASPASVVSGEKSAGQREVEQHAELEVFAGRHHPLLDAPVQKIVVILRRDEAIQIQMSRCPVGVGGLPGVEVRVSEVAHLTRVDQIIECTQRLLDGSFRVGYVLLIEVDVVGVRSARARFHCIHDVVTRGAAVQHTLAHAVAELGGDDDLRAVVFADHPARQ